MDVLAVYHDKGLSGKRADNRPGLQEALIHVCREKGVLVVYALARLARSTKDAIVLSETLAKQQANLAIVTQSVDTTTAMGRAFFKIMAVIAELELETTGERTAAKLAQMRKDGFRTSSQIPYGYAVDPKDSSRIVKSNYEVGIIECILRLNKQGMNTCQTCKELDRAGLKPRGYRWHPSSIRRIILENQID